MKSNMQEIYSKQWNLGDLGSGKRIIYCAKVYESTSLIGMSVWWLNVGFFGCGRLKVFQSTANLQKVFCRIWLSSSLKFCESAPMKKLVSD
jgi:hypothetical protein